MIKLKKATPILLTEKQEIIFIKLAKGWLNPKIDDPEEFKEQVKNVCDVYHQAPELEEKNL